MSASPLVFRLALSALFALACLTQSPAFGHEEAAAESTVEDTEATETDSAAVTTDAQEATNDADAASDGEEADAEAGQTDEAEEEEKEPTKVRYAEFILSGTLPESPGGSGPFADINIDLRKQIARIDRAAEDDKIEGLVLRLRDFGIGRGGREELRHAIKRFRETGKRAVAELEVASGASYLIAAACDEIVMPESGFMIIAGVRAEPLFFKGMLAKIGVKPDFLHVGEAKGAAEPFTRRRWSEPVRENITSLIDDLYDQMVDTITADRPMTRERVVEAIDRGLLTAGEAKEFGLVDRLAYPGSLRGELAERHEADKLVYVRNYGQKEVDTDFSGPAGFFKLLGMMAGGGKPGARAGKRIAVVYAVGPIMTGKSEVDPFGETTSVGSTTVVEALDKAAKDKRTAAIVLRVTSPGGSAVASDLIWNKVCSIEKPVVVSMGDVAASGGYYISMGADRIYAEPTTVTGSIGVVSGKFALKGMFSKMGISSDLVTRGENSGLFSAMKRFTPSERDALVDLMDDCYDQFTAKAAQGRGMTQDRIKELGGGKVYTGRQAERLGLVDELGDLNAAVEGAKRLAGLDADEEVRIRTYPEAVDFFKSIFGDADAEKEVRVDLGDVLSMGGAAPEIEEAVRAAATLRRVFAHEPVALLMPYAISIED